MWYLILSRREAPPDALSGHLADHLAWMKSQHEAGRVLFSGPSSDRSMGIYVIRADSLEQAKSITSTDPFHASGLRRPEVIEWEIHQILGAGSFTPAGIGAATDE